ncbi:APC family permease [Actinoplanes sandaracinus]|nr:amino acid permease [Actinoplanes sandaracinus]
MSTALARDRIGWKTIGLTVISAVAPLTVAAGIITLAFGVTGKAGIAIGLIVIGLLLMVFSDGFLGVAGRIRNAGAAYSFAAQALSKPVAVGVALMALLAYGFFATGGYGGLGGTAAPVLSEWFGFNVPWVAVALVAWAFVAFLGMIDFSASQKVLAVLVGLETLLVVVFDAALVSSPGFEWSFEPLALSSLWGENFGIIAVIAFTCFAGLELTASFAEEARDAARAVRLATFSALGVAVLLYAFTAVAIFSAASSVAGSDVYQRALEEGPLMFFGLAAEQLGPWAVNAGFLLFGTSVLAANIAFHSLLARYGYALGRESVLPQVFGRTVGGAPRNSSILQSAIGLVTILVFAVGGWDPMTEYFFVFGTSGGLGVALLITIMTLSVIGFFQRHPSGEPLWRRVLLPVVALVFLLIITYLMITNLPGLYGTDGWTGPSVLVPAAYAALFVIGVVWGLVLRKRRPDVYRGIGLGTASAVPAAPGGTQSQTRVGAGR